MRGIDKVPFKVDKNGTEYYYNWTCERCGGQGGSEAWKYTGFTCYECGGTGITPRPRIIKKYTPEYEKKLEAQRQKRYEKKLAERKAEADARNAEFLEKFGFDKNGVTWVVLGNTYEKKDELKALGCKYDSVLGWHANHDLDGFDTFEINVSFCFAQDDAGVYSGWEHKDGLVSMVKAERDKYAAMNNKSEYVGNVGDKVEVSVELKNRFDFETKFGWKTEYFTIYNMVDNVGNVYVWKTTGYLHTGTGHPIEIGDKFTVKGTVKDHSEYKGVKQTVLQRCRIA